MALPRIVRWVAGGVAALLLGSLAPLLSTQSASAFTCPPFSSLCSPAALPVLIDLGIATGTEATAAAGGAAAGATVATGATTALAPTLGSGITGVYVALAGGVVAAGLGAAGITAATRLSTDPHHGETAGGATAACDGLGMCATFLGMGTLNAGDHRAVECWGITGAHANNLVIRGGGSPIASGQLDGSFFISTFPGTCTSDFPTANGMWDTTFAPDSYYFTDGGGTPIGSVGGTGAPTGAPGWHGTLRTTVTCTSASGDRPETATTPIDVDAGVDLPVPGALCGPGELATSAIIEYQPVGGGAWQPLVSGTVPGSVAGLITAYPDCFGPEVINPCTMQLYNATVAPPATCGPGATFCPDWASDPNASINYQCRYGTTVIELTYCSAFRAPRVGILPNVGPLDDTTPLPITAPVPSPLPNAIQDPGTGTGTVPDPSPTPGTDNASCWPSGWGVLNPAAWVLMPIKCAFEWAFVPNKAQLNQTTSTMRQAIQGSAVGSVIGIVSGWASFPITATGCDGIHLHFELVTVPVDTHLLAACAGDTLHDTAGTVKFLLSGAVIIAGVLAIVRSVASIFGYVGYGGIVDAERREAYRAEARAARKNHR